MTAEQTLAALVVAGIEVRVTSTGDIHAKLTPPRDLLAQLIANKAGVLALLRMPSPEPAPCARGVEGSDLPTGLAPVRDAEGRNIGWLLEPGWHPRSPPENEPQPANPNPSWRWLGDYWWADPETGHLHWCET